MQFRTMGITPAAIAILFALSAPAAPLMAHEPPVVANEPPVVANEPPIIADAPAIIANTAGPPPAALDTGRDAAQPAPPADSAPGAQDADEKKPPTPVHTGFKALLFGLGEDVKHLPSKPNLYIALIGGAAALAVRPLDDDVNIALKSHYDVVNEMYKPAHIIGQSPVEMGAAVLTYAYGRLEHAPKVSHFGMDLLRAQIIDEVLTEGLKRAVRRERPNGADHLSFPSGHASVTFATATVIERHLGWRAAGLGYLFAAYIGSSRLHDNVHWLSDVVFGAVVGTISGRTVTQHGRNYWTFTPVPVAGHSVALMATHTTSNTRQRSTSASRFESARCCDYAVTSEKRAGSR